MFARNIQVCRGSTLGTLVLRVDPYIVGKSEKPLDMGEFTLRAEKAACFQL